MQIMLVFVVALIATPLAINCVDETIIPRARGQDVVDAVVRNIQRSKIFKDDRSFLKRIAYVESTFGHDGHTLELEYFGGVWQVSAEIYAKTKSSALAKFHDQIKYEFLIDWVASTWSDLLKPIYSGLATRLYLQTLNGGTPIAGIDAQGDFWVRNYNDNSSWNLQYFVRKVNELELDPTCQGVVDISMVMDGSGSIGAADFERSKESAANLVGSFSLNSTRIGFIAYEGTTARLIFDVENQLTIESMKSAIKGTPYLAGGTPTAVGMQASIQSLESASVRDGVPRAMLVYTDGASTKPTDVILAAERCKELGIIGVAIGIGAGINEAELIVIAQGDTSNVFMVNSFTELLEWFTQFNKVICEIPQKPEVGTIVTDSLNYKEKRYYNYKLPTNGLTIKSTTYTGDVSGYYSYKEEIPSSAVHDGIIKGQTFISGTNKDEVHISFVGLAKTKNQYSVLATQGSFANLCAEGIGFVADQDNCNLYYQCTAATADPYSVACPCCSGNNCMVFNPNQKMCVSAQEYTCF